MQTRRLFLRSYHNSNREVPLPASRGETRKSSLELLLPLLGQSGGMDPTRAPFPLVDSPLQTVWAACRAVIFGITVIAVGLAMAILGYFDRHFATVSCLLLP